MSKRYEELDSLRGIAALFVVFLHMYLIIPWNGLYKILFEYTPLRLLISGGEAVILFFVLSGFVLSLPYYKNTQINYISFMIKRILRIYIPYIVSFILFIVAKELIYTGKIQGLSSWFNSFWSSSISSKTILDHTIMVDTFMSNLNPVVWSLVHEMRISLLFPLLMIPLVKLNWKKNIILCLLLSAFAVLVFSFFKPTNTGTEFAATINYTSMFIVGALIAKYSVNISLAFVKLNKTSKIALFAFGLITYLFIHPSFAIKLFIFPNIPPFFRTVVDSWAVMIGAAILIIFAINSALFSKILKFNVIGFLGKISYSLYLIHIVILFSSIHLLNGIIPLWSILGVALLITILISSVLYKYVELPSIKLGKLIVDKIAKTKTPRLSNQIDDIPQSAVIKNNIATK